MSEDKQIANETEEEKKKSSLEMHVVGNDEEEPEDFFDMTSIAANIGCYTPAPKQAREYLNAEEKDKVLQEVLAKMDADEKNKDLSDQETEETFEEQYAKAIAEKHKEVFGAKPQVKATDISKDDEDLFVPRENQEEEQERCKLLKGGDLHLLKIERDCPRNTVLDILREMALEVEQILRGKKPFDFAEVPCFLTVQDWNKDISELSGDEYWEVDLKEPYDLEPCGCGEIDADLVPLINIAVRCFSFYHKKANFMEEDDIWLETLQDGPHPMHTLAKKVIQALRNVMPENVDKMCGFDMAHPFSDGSLAAFKARKDMFSEQEKKMHEKLVQTWTDNIGKQLKEGETLEQVLKVYLISGGIMKYVMKEIVCDIDETEVHKIMYGCMLMEDVSEQLVGKTIQELVNTTTDAQVDEAFIRFIQRMQEGSDNGKAKI